MSFPPSWRSRSRRSFLPRSPACPSIAGTPLVFKSSSSTRSISQNAERLASDVAPRSWEYHVEFLADSAGLAVLQQRGLEGWQVVNFRRAQNAEVWGSEVLFRRPKP